MSDDAGKLRVPLGETKDYMSSPIRHIKFYLDNKA